MLIPNKIKVLIVDDALLITVRLKQIVQDIGNVTDIFIASNFSDAITVLQKQEVHIVLLDIFLNEESGIDLLKYITAHYPLVKVIMVTNKPTEINRTLCIKSGAYAFVDKTEEFEYIPTIISSITDKFFQ